MRKSRIQTMSRYAYLSVYCTPLHGLSEWEKKSNANIFVTQTISLSQYITMWFPLSNQKNANAVKFFHDFEICNPKCMYYHTHTLTHSQNTHIYTCPESLNHANTTMIWITFHPKMHSFEINSISHVCVCEFQNISTQNICLLYEIFEWRCVFGSYRSFTMPKNTISFKNFISQSIAPRRNISNFAEYPTLEFFLLHFIQSAIY